MMIAVVIIGVASALVVPGFREANSRAQLKQAIIELQGDLNLARMAAMNRNRNVTVTLALMSGRVEATFQGVVPDAIMPVGIIAFAGTNPLTFNSYGMLAGVNANQQITLTNDRGLTYSVQVTPGGRTKWCASATCP
jgi:Tfp pilus assembly protein FimT